MGLRSGLHAVALALLAVASTGPAQAQVQQAATVDGARSVLDEIMTAPGKSIPQSMLAKAEGVAIIPGVVKVGLVAGVRHGEGVVLVRDEKGVWQPPNFVSLTGGSVGWQAGVQSTDVILVFQTRKSIEGLLQGKFTIGADAAVAAGPIGRETSAGTDGRLKAEVYSYSRARGLFAGVSLDGSAIKTDPAAGQAYYQSAPAGQLPPSASRLLANLTRYSGGADGAAVAANPQPAPLVGQPVAGQPLAAQPAASAAEIEAARRGLATNSLKMYALLDSNWQRYLALPREVFAEGGVAPLAGIELALRHFDAVTKNAQFSALSSRAEFQATHEALKAYYQAVAPRSPATIQLPPPPGEAAGAAAPTGPRY